MRVTTNHWLGTQFHYLSKQLNLQHIGDYFSVIHWYVYTYLLAYFVVCLCPIIACQSVVFIFACSSCYCRTSFRLARVTSASPNTIKLTTTQMLPIFVCSLHAAFWLTSVQWSIGIRAVTRPYCQEGNWHFRGG